MKGSISIKEKCSRFVDELDNSTLAMYLVLSLLCISAVSGTATLKSGEPEVCMPQSPGGVKFILSQGQRYGWKENTQRANIILALNRWEFAKEEKEKMDLHLERSITKLILRNGETSVSINDLALTANALVSTGKNPRNFKSIDLCLHLLERVNQQAEPHPFIVNAMCYCRIVEFHHLEKIKRYIRSGRNLNARETGMKAMALKAMACAASLPGGSKFQLFAEAMEGAAEDLIFLQANATFDVYTTSLIVQALSSYGKNYNDGKALDFLRKESEIEPNIIKLYYIEMALHAKNVRFLKDLYQGSYEPEQSTSAIAITISIKDTLEPGKDFSITVKVPSNWNLMQILDEASSVTSKMKCIYIKDQNSFPLLIQVGETPNDPEKDLYWRICQQDLERNAHSMLPPEDGENIILTYGPNECSSDE